jgi:hypothetical protein
MQVLTNGAGEGALVEDHAVFAERARDAVIALREI